MLINDLQKIVDEGKLQNKPLEYIKIELKEALIIRTLDFIYNSPHYNQLIFTGGTALKIIGKTSRLSEDLDLDYLDEAIDLKKIADDLVSHFKNFGIDDLKFTIRAEEKILTIKFPILLKLGLVNNAKNESDLLFLKIELEKNPYPSFQTQTTPIMTDNLFFVIRHYDFPTLFANKIGAILGRKGKVFYDKYDFKGRDFYDLIWFLENKIQPNLERVKEILKNEQNLEINTYDELWPLLKDRIEKINTNGIYDDMKNLLSANESVKTLAKNYLAIYLKLVDGLKDN